MVQECFKWQDLDGKLPRAECPANPIRLGRHSNLYLLMAVLAIWQSRVAASLTSRSPKREHPNKPMTLTAIHGAHSLSAAVGRTKMKHR